MAGPLSGRVALVTGAARGIGLAIATRLAEAGAHAIIHDRDAGAADAATADLQVQGLAASALIACLADAKALNAWAVSTGIGRMSMWSANRDKTCGSNYVDLTVVSDACSGVNQGKQTFAGLLSKGFDGRIALGEGAVTTAEPTSAATADDPAHSPYSIWTATNSYLKGTKVTWHHNVYQAKWWTKGDVPDNPVLNAWETPWELVGPVLPGETPIPQPTLPAGTYPNWSGETPYDKGTRVLFDGVPFEAKWWTQGDSPEAASANPDSSPWAPLTQDEIDTILGGGTPQK